MSNRLKAAFEEAAKLSESDQDAFAEFILAELRDEAAWNAKLASTPSLLEKMAAEALGEHERERTRPLDDLLK